VMSAIEGKGWTILGGYGDVETVRMAQMIVVGAMSGRVSPLASSYLGNNGRCGHHGGGWKKRPVTYPSCDEFAYRSITRQFENQVCHSITWTICIDEYYRYMINGMWGVKRDRGLEVNQRQTSVIGTNNELTRRPTKLRREMSPQRIS